MTNPTQETLIMEEILPQYEAQVLEEIERSPLNSSLGKMLGLGSRISTPSTEAQNQQSAVGKRVGFREIGKGSIGVIFEHPGTNQCYKLALTDDPMKIWNNYQMQTRICDAFDEARSHLDMITKVPQIFGYATPKAFTFWNDRLTQFPFHENIPREAPPRSIHGEDIAPPTPSPRLPS
jgi:hypothetical protein